MAIESVPCTEQYKEVTMINHTDPELRTERESMESNRFMKFVLTWPKVIFSRHLSTIHHFTALWAITNKELEAYILYIGWGLI